MTREPEGSRRDRRRHSCSGRGMLCGGADDVRLLPLVRHRSNRRGFHLGRGLFVLFLYRSTLILVVKIDLPTQARVSTSRRDQRKSLVTLDRCT